MIEDGRKFGYPPETVALASFMHEQYEQAARATGWETQEGTSVPFSELPPENRQTMLMVAHMVRARVYAYPDRYGVR